MNNGKPREETGFEWRLEKPEGVFMCNGQWQLVPDRATLI